MTTIGMLYNNKDERFVDKLSVYFAPLRRQGHFFVKPTCAEHLRGIDILLVLLSPYFLVQQSLIDIVDAAQGCRIVPIVLRDIDMRNAPARCKTLQALPRNGKPVSRQDVDYAFSEIAREISRVVENIRQ